MRTRVLVVDDEPDLLELIHYNLTKAGYDVVGVLSGEEALGHVRVSLPISLCWTCYCLASMGWKCVGRCDAIRRLRAFLL